MRYGLLGEKLGHSFSKEIHESINDYKYDLIEVEKESLDSFMKNRDFKAINVTIPYKEKVIHYLYYIDDVAKRIGAVNTIVNKNGKLYGYNTDYYGLKSLIESKNVNIKGFDILILGTGGTSKTATQVAIDLGCKSITYVSINNEEGTISYHDAITKYNDVDMIINTTPCGMYPNTMDLIIDLTKFNNLKLVIDVIYNPLKTRLGILAEELNIPYACGLYMLVSQAVYASSIFTDKVIENKVTDEIYQKLYEEKQNIVLIGMPSCGKTTISKMLEDKLNKKCIDIDNLVEEKLGMSIKEHISLYGEASFRKVEKEIVLEASKKNNLIISTGGGVIKDYDNIVSLKGNGKVIFIDRDISLLTPTSSRPLSSNISDLKKLYDERLPLYKKYADVVISNNGSIEDTINEIIKNI